MRLRIYLRVWWWARKRALEHVASEYPEEYRDAIRAWSRHARMTGDLDSPAWNIRGLADDLALHDAADSVLGRQA